MKVRCEGCQFKFEQNTKGRKAKFCQTCRQDRADRWKKEQDKKKSTPKGGGIEGY